MDCEVQELMFRKYGISHIYISGNIALLAYGIFICSHLSSMQRYLVNANFKTPSLLPCYVFVYTYRT